MVAAALPRDPLDEFVFNAGSTLPQQRSEIDTSAGGVESIEMFNYDDIGNLVLREEFGDDRRLLRTTRYEYETVLDAIPNLPLREIANDIDQF